MHLLHPVPVSLVFRRRFQARLLDQSEHFNRTVTALFPKGRIQFLKELEGVKVPAEPEIEGDPPKGLQALGNPGNHGNVERPLLGRRDRRCHKGVRLKGLAVLGQQFFHLIRFTWV